MAHPFSVFLFARIAVLFAVAIAGTTANAQDARRTLSFQTILTNTLGQPISGSQNITFKIYHDTVSGGVLWLEQQTLPVTGGVLSAALGEKTNFPATLFDAPCFLEITIEGNSPMRPFIPLRGVAFSLRAAVADSVVGGSSQSGVASINTLKNNVMLQGDGEMQITLDVPHNAIHFAAAPGTPDTARWLDSLQALRALIDGLGVPVGTILAFGGDPSQIPLGWLLCDGRVYSRNSSLFTAIGIAWGVGDGIATFNIPDLRGLFLRGTSGSRLDSLADPDSSSRYSINGGNSGNKIGSIESDALQNHVHMYTASTVSTDTPRSFQNGSSWSVVYDSTIRSHPPSGDQLNIPWPRVSQFESRPKNAYVNWIIKVK